jgi:hypothetical protein
MDSSIPTERVATQSSNDRLSSLLYLRKDVVKIPRSLFERVTDAL